MHESESSPRVAAATPLLTSIAGQIGTDLPRLLHKVRAFVDDVWGDPDGRHLHIRPGLGSPKSFDVGKDGVLEIVWEPWLDLAEILSRAASVNFEQTRKLLAKDHASQDELRKVVSSSAATWASRFGSWKDWLDNLLRKNVSAAMEIQEAVAEVLGAGALMGHSQRWIIHPVRLVKSYFMSSRTESNILKLKFEVHLAMEGRAGARAGTVLGSAPPKVPPAHASDIAKAHQAHRPPPEVAKLLPRMPARLMSKTQRSPEQRALVKDLLRDPAQTVDSLFKLHQASHNYYLNSGFDVFAPDHSAESLALAQAMNLWRATKDALTTKVQKQKKGAARAVESSDFVPPAWLAKIPAEAPLAEYEKHAPAWVKPYLHRHLSEDPRMEPDRMLRDKNMQPIVVELMDKLLKGAVSDSAADQMYQEAFEYKSDLARQRISLQKGKEKPGEGLAKAGWRAYSIWSALNQAMQFTERLKEQGMDHLLPFMRKGLKTLGWGDRGEKVRTAKEFPSDKALRQYLKEHPRADPANHSVAPHDGDRDPFQDLQKGTKAERVHQMLAPKGIADLYDSKLPQVTRDNQATILRKNPSLAKVVKTAEGMSEDELREASRAAGEYVTKLRERMEDIEAASGDPDPELKRAFNQAHAVWFALGEAGKKSGGRRAQEGQAMHDVNKRSSLDELTHLAGDVSARFEEGKPADPTQNMSEDDALEWDQKNEEYGDKFKEAGFSEGQPADPTENMSPEDAEKWREMNQEYGDKFKEASFEEFASGVLAEGPQDLDVETLVKLAGLMQHLPSEFKKMRPQIDKIEARLRASKGPQDQALARILDRASEAVTEVMNAGDKLGRAARDPKHRFGSPLADLERLSRFEAGKPADPTKHMSEEDAAKWGEMNEKYGDKFKAACDRAAESLRGAAAKIARRAFEADPRVGLFFGARAARRGCEVAKMLGGVLSAMGAAAPAGKAAGAVGTYGLAEATALAGLRACGELEVVAGRVAARLLESPEDRTHLRAALLHKARRERCAQARLLAACAPA